MAARGRPTSRSAGLGRARGAPEDICLACGLCCTGAIFADVRLQPGDEPSPLQASGLPLRLSPPRKLSVPAHPAAVPVRSFRFSQPCVCFDACGCRIYASRPRHCRLFECGVLRSLKAGRTTRKTALRIIHSALVKVMRTERLLREFGDTDQGLPLAKRFRRTSRRLETVALKPGMAHRYGKLTLAFHDLNLLLSEAFYPGHSAHDF